MDIVKGQKGDVPDVLDIISRCTKHMESQRIYQWDEAYPDANIIEEDIESGHSYVIKDKGRCIAYAAINEEIEEEPPEHSQLKWSSDGRKVLFIHRLAVLPEYQGRGIAKKMLGFIEDFALKNDYSSTRLVAYGGNETALKLYENFGYKRAGQLRYPHMEYPFCCYEKDI